MVVDIDDDYTLTANDNGAVIVSAASAGIEITVPANLPVGFNCLIVQADTGAVTIIDDGTTTIVNADSQFDTGGSYAAVTLVSIAANVFVLAGKTA